MWLFETGGYWLWRRGRMVPPARGFSLAVDMLDAVEEMLVCRLDTLGLLRMEPVRDRVWV